eukprot:1180816-Prorocentrum_minimum.AAC.2
MTMVDVNQEEASERRLVEELDLRFSVSINNGSLVRCPVVSRQRAPITEGEREYTRSGHQSHKGRNNILRATSSVGKRSGAMGAMTRGHECAQKKFFFPGQTRRAQPTQTFAFHPFGVLRHRPGTLFAQAEYRWSGAHFHDSAVVLNVPLGAAPSRLQN